ncbi:MAG: hypothetical protein RLZZ86_621 [Cyanobacteriota bacterium]|jgi:hypothetical protein
MTAQDWEDIRQYTSYHCQKKQSSQTQSYSDSSSR